MAKDPKDSRIMEYKDTISQQNMTIKSQNELIVSLQKTIDSNNEAMAVMNEKIDYLTKKLFGTSSEKSKNVEGQLSLFDEAEQEAGAYEEPEAEGTVVKEHTRKAKGTHAELFKGVPVKDEVIPLSEEQKHCGDCGAEMEVIGREFVRQEFRFTPAKGEVVNIYRETAKCPACSQAPAMERAVAPRSIKPSSNRFPSPRRFPQILSRPPAAAPAAMIHMMVVFMVYPVSFVFCIPKGHRIERSLSVIIE